MLIDEMTEDECRAMLQRMDFGRLACVCDSQPYIVPIYFSYAAGHVYGITTLGQKIHWMRSNPLVCLEVDDRTEHDQWMSVVVFGRYQELPDTADYRHARARALEALQKRTMWWEPACVPAQHGERRQPILYRIDIERVTGRRARPAAIETV